MARRPGADPIYEVADLYRSRCLGQGRSLLWPARPSFTIENLQELWDAYIENPDLSKKSFYEKWELQLQNRSADVHRVAADLTVLYNLYPSTYWPSWKREQVLSVASWKLANDSPELEPIVAAFEAGGIGSAGPYYNFGRPWQFAFYLKFSQRMLRTGADPQSLEAAKANALAAEEEVGHACAEARNISPLPALPGSTWSGLRANRTSAWCGRLTRSTQVKRTTSIEALRQHQDGPR